MYNGFAKRKVTVIRSAPSYTCSVTLTQRAMNCTFGNSKELSFIAERSKENMEDQLLSCMVFMYGSQTVSEFKGNSVLENRYRACSFSAFKQENPIPLVHSCPSPTHTIFPAYFPAL